MPKFSLEVPHTLGAAGARAKLEHFIEMMQSKLQDKVSDLSQAWAGNTLAFGFKTYGIKVNGAIEVLEESLKTTVEIPFAAMMFKGKIESEVRQQLERLVK